MSRLVSRGCYPGSRLAQIAFCIMVTRTFREAWGGSDVACVGIHDDWYLAGSAARIGAGWAGFTRLLERDGAQLQPSKCSLLAPAAYAEGRPLRRGAHRLAALVPLAVGGGITALGSGFAVDRHFWLSAHGPPQGSPPSNVPCEA